MFTELLCLRAAARDESGVGGEPSAGCDGRSGIRDGGSPVRVVEWFSAFRRDSLTAAAIRAAGPRRPAVRTRRARSRAAPGRHC
jgi:hypothetical protein